MAKVGEAAQAFMGRAQGASFIGFFVLHVSSLFHELSKHTSTGMEESTRARGTSKFKWCEGAMAAQQAGNATESQRLMLGCLAVLKQTAEDIVKDHPQYAPYA